WSPGSGMAEVAHATDQSVLIPAGYCDIATEILDAPEFFFTDAAPPQYYTLSLHDALPICMTFPILASLLVRLVVLLPFQLLRLSLATPSRWTPLALSVFLHCVVALLLTLL